MVNKKKHNFFLTLPKKELQTLCRKYGIPAYKPKPYLAEALAALLPENIELKELKRKFADASFSHPIEHDDSSLDLNALPRISGKKYLSVTGIGRKAGVPGTSKAPAESALIESVRCVEVSAPTFEFHVRSEGGINLYVDLNSTCTEWAESLKKNICIMESNICTKSRQSHVDLGQLGESSSHLKDSSPTTVDDINFEHSLSGTAPNSENKESSCKDVDCLDRIDSSLMSSVEVSHMTDVGLSRHIEENGVLMLPKSISCAQSQVPVSASTDEPKIDYVGDSVSNSVSDGAISFLTTEQPLKAITEECGNSPVRYNHSPSHLGSTLHGCSIFASAETHLLEAADFQKDKASPCETNGIGFVDHNCNMESEHGESANSSEVDHGTERNQLLCSEKEERSSTASEMEISEFSQFVKPHERNSLIADDFESSGNYPKRQSTDGVGGYCFSDPEAGNLRRSSHLVGEVLPRRSMRELVSCTQTT